MNTKREHTKLPSVQITRTHLSDTDLDVFQNFMKPDHPGANFQKHYRITLQDQCIGYYVLEFPIFHDDVVLHPYFIPECRSRGNFRRMQEVFVKEVIPGLQEDRIKGIVVSCPVEDTKTTELIKSFGFSTQGILFGSMPI